MKTIPTRRRIPILTELLEMREMTQTPVGYCERMVRTYGDVCHVPLPGVSNYMIHDPVLLQEIFINQSAKFCKSRLYKAMRKVIGYGLLTNDGEHHRQQRRLVAPAFHRQRIQEYATTMVNSTLEEMENWSDGSTVNVQDSMAAITMRVITQTMFSSRIGNEQLAAIGRIVTELLEEAAGVFQNPFSLICFEKDIRIPSVKRVHDLTKEVDVLINDIIRSYRKDEKSSRNDMLSLLMQAKDEESGAALDDKQIRDEVITMFMAGHETTATALSWVWYLLGKNPEVEHKFHEEVDAVIGKRTPTAEDYESLRFTRDVFKETLRVYPPVWTIAREPLEDIEIMGYHFPKGSVLCTISTIMHHKEEFFPEPLAFKPERWKEPAMENLPRFVFFPFGGGNRMCIGEGFAWMEASLVMSTIASRYRLQIDPAFSTQVKPLFTLRPRDAIFARAVAR